MKGKKSSVKLKALCAAFPYTLPICAGFGFIGLAYGVYMNTSGFSFIYPMLTSLTVFGGSLEFVTVTMLLSTYAPLQALLMALMIQARHLFYGISMLEKYKGTGAKKLYLIFGLCDETFSINYSVDIPDDVDKGWFMFFVTLLNHIYWVVGATAGGLLGSLITFNTTGIDFVMTAMFVVIFIDQWMKEKSHISSLIGVVLSAACLVIFGSDYFMIPTMACIICALVLIRKPIERRENQ